MMNRPTLHACTRVRHETSYSSVWSLKKLRALISSVAYFETFIGETIHNRDGVLLVFIKHLVLLTQELFR